MPIVKLILLDIFLQAKKMLTIIKQKVIRSHIWPLRVAVPVCHPEPRMKFQSIFCNTSSGFHPNTTKEKRQYLFAICSYILRHIFSKTVNKIIIHPKLKSFTQALLVMLMTFRKSVPRHDASRIRFSAKTAQPRRLNYLQFVQIL